RRGRVRRPGREGASSAAAAAAFNLRSRSIPRFGEGDLVRLGEGESSGLAPDDARGVLVAPGARFVAGGGGGGPSAVAAASAGSDATAASVVAAAAFSLRYRSR
ncbi:hypothetical protein ACHAWF_009291, partial [Thalassiosira exigua]